MEFVKIFDKTIADDLFSKGFCFTKETISKDKVVYSFENSKELRKYMSTKYANCQKAFSNKLFF